MTILVRTSAVRCSYPFLLELTKKGPLKGPFVQSGGVSLICAYRQRVKFAEIERADIP